MLQFKKTELMDIGTIRPFFQNQRSRLCDGTPGGVILWRNFFKAEHAIVGDTLFFRVGYVNNRTCFTFPIGGDTQKALEIIREYSLSHGSDQCSFCTISKGDYEQVAKTFKIVESKSDRGWFDYLYDANDLISFKGKRYNGQRNHINRFKRTYPDYRFEEITEQNIPEVRAFYEEFVEIYHKDARMAEAEIGIIRELLDNYGVYGLLGGVIRAGGKIISMAIGERLLDTLFVHIEKADIRYHGAYQIIVNEYAAHFVNEGIRYINREEDVGDEGLRTSKLSYHPVALLEKFSVVVDLK